LEYRIGISYWNGISEWNIGMEYRNGISEWNIGMEYRNGISEWNIGMERAIFRARLSKAAMIIMNAVIDGYVIIMIVS